LDFIKNCNAFSDEELALKAKSGDVSCFEHLAEKYKPLLLSKISKYISCGFYEDLKQESYLGFYKAIIAYDIKKGVPFAAFAEVCVQRQLLSSIKAHEKFNTESLSFDEIEDISVSLEEAVIDRQTSRDLLSLLEEKLSGYERQVLRLYLLDLTYEQISKKLSKNIKSVDNALKRIKKKIATDL